MWRARFAGTTDMSLAARLPVFHPYAGGYPGLGSQTVPTDSDAIDYLQRMAAVDASSDGVEVGVATAVDAFFRGLKATPGLFDAIKASCILCGARTITGALVPLAGDAPTSNGFVSGDYSRTNGITGDGTSYIDSGRANDDDPQDDQHMAVHVTAANTLDPAVLMGSGPNSSTGANQITNASNASATGLVVYSRLSSALAFDVIANARNSVGLQGISRNAAASYTGRALGASATITRASATPTADNIFVFDRGPTGGHAPSNATIAFYSIGTSLSLEDLDAAVNNLITAIGNAL